MAKKKQKKKKKTPEQAPRPKDFLDMIAPAAAKFNTDHFILGSRYHTAMALKSYPPMTDELALLRGLGDMGGVNLRLTARQVTPAEEDAIQFSSASSREFVLAIPLHEKTDAGEGTLRQMEKSICDHGLRVRLAEEQDVKRLLAIYYRQDLTTEVFRDFDGEEYVHG